MRTITLILIGLLASKSVFSIPQGISCDNPMNAVIGNNTANNASGQDQWYRFTAPKNGRMILSTCGTTTEDTYVEVYNTCGSFATDYNNWGCNDQAKLVVPVFEGNTYLIRWAGIFTSATYSWTLSIEDPIPGEFCVTPLTAKEDTNECDHTGNIDQWFEYKATNDGYVTISSCGLTSEDTYVGVFSNCWNSFITESNDFCSKQSQVKFKVTKNVNYYIKWYKHMTTGKYKWTLKYEPPLPGELCSTAKEAKIGSSNFADHTSNIDQWFYYKATKNGRITATTCGLTTERTFLITMMDCWWQLTDYKQTACGNQTKIRFKGIKDYVYFFRWSNAYTSGSYNWELKEEDALPGEFNFVPITAHLDTNICDHSEGIDQWFVYTASKDGSIEISSCNLTSENTFVSVYKSSSPNTPIISNNDFCSKQSYVKFECRKGETFLIGWYNYYTSGTYKWILKETEPMPGEYYFTAHQTNVGINTANHMGNIDQWFVYRPKKNNKLHITSCGRTTENTMVAVYDSVTLAVEKAFNDNTCGNQSEIYMEAIAGKTYYIRWYKNYTSSSYDFLLEELEIPQGEYCSNPKIAQKGTNTSDHSGGVDQWFKYTATKTGKVAISTCETTDLSTNMSIGNSCDVSDPIDHYVTSCGSQYTLSFLAIQNQTYYIKWFNNGGSYNWVLTEAEPSAGEFCITAKPAIKGTNTSEHVGSNNLWFYYVPTKNCKISISTCGLTTQQVGMGVYTSCQSYEEVPKMIVYCENFQHTYNFQGIKGQKYYLIWGGMSITQPYQWTLSESEAQEGEFCIKPLPAKKDTNFSDHSSNFDRWYAYTAKVNGTLRISNCGLTLYNTNLEVYSSCEQSPIATAFSTCFTQSEVNIACKYGTTYYIHWQCGEKVSFPWVIEETSDGTLTPSLIDNILQIFPNPTNGKLFVIWNHNKSATIEVYNMQGKVMFSDRLMRGKNCYNLSHLTKGLFLLKVRNENSVYFFKILKN
ncbi:MAG: T9SS type A sorting domain-containing protein [Bacteroidales bacterium]|nr:T9SS type A sorting domain-containing protein [Bacteroidales bacterium]